MVVKTEGKRNVKNKLNIIISKSWWYNEIKNLKIKLFSYKQLKALLIYLAACNTITLSEQLSNQSEILRNDIVANGLQLNNDLLLSNLQGIQLANSLGNYSTELCYGN